MEKQKNIPQLRFHEFEGEWKKTALSEVGENIIGLTYSPKDVNEEGILVLRSSNINEDALELNDQVRVKTNISEKLIIKKRDILICTRNGSQRLIGKNVIIQDDTTKMTFGAFMSVFRSEMNSFIVHLMKTEWYNKQINMNLGARINQITTGQLNRFWFYFPAIPEQQKIASFFTAIDQKIFQLKRKKTLLEEYKKGVMQKIFSQEIRFKDDNGQEFPKWEKKRLGELTYKTGKKNKGSTPYPIYSINNREGFLPQGDQFEGVDSNSRGYDISLYKIIEEKTFAYNPARINVGSIGFSGDLKDIIISSLYVCFKTKQGVEDAYLLHYLKTFQFNKSVLQNVEGGVRDYLFYENFSNIKINLPSNKEQVKIANFLSAIDDKINHTQKQVEKAEVWKKGLMQQMFV